MHIKTLSKGVTRPRRVTLTDGTLTHDAVFQIVNETKPVERFSTGRVELDFRDSWHFNIAAFELARLIGLDDMVPACVERIIQSERGSLCWWVTWKWDEQMRVKEKLRPPDPVRLAAAVGRDARLPGAGRRHRPQPDQHADHRGLEGLDGGLHAARSARPRAS